MSMTTKQSMKKRVETVITLTWNPHHEVSAANGSQKKSTKPNQRARAKRSSSPSICWSPILADGIEKRGEVVVGMKREM